MLTSAKTYKLLIISCLFFIFGVSQLGYSNSSPVSHFTIDFELVNGLIVVEATINSKKGSYILDTGFSFLAVEGDPTRPSMTMATTEFNISASEVKVENFEFGRIKEIWIKSINLSIEILMA